MKNIILKILAVFTKIRWCHVPYKYLYFYRDTYYCQLLQWKYMLADYVFKRKYKTISFHGEFACELLFVLPFAYWHHKNGTLKTTIASKGTRSLYYFSEDHSEQFCERTPEANYNYETPRVIYSHNYNMRKWLPVPLKGQYKNDIYIFDKPILIIANRYNSEWDGPPISFFSMDILDRMIRMTRDQFVIVYNRPRPHQITEDNSTIYDLDEFDWLRQQHPDVVLMEDLYRENAISAPDYNSLQLAVYANSEHFISIHGGTATLASYFGGTNVILSKQGPEHYFGCFQKLYPKLSGAAIYHAKSDEELLDSVDRFIIGAARSF